MKETFAQNVKHKIAKTGNTVMVVDDDLPARRLVSRTIEKFSPDVTIIEALNGKEALKKLREMRDKGGGDPLLIVTDLNMPIMDGWELIAELKQDYESRGKRQGIPIIALSSTSGEKGILFMRQSVHRRKSSYSPIISVAKEYCLDSSRYDASGPHGLEAWLEFFLQ